MDANTSPARTAVELREAIRANLAATVGVGGHNRRARMDAYTETLRAELAKTPDVVTPDAGSSFLVYRESFAPDMHIATADVVDYPRLSLCGAVVNSAVSGQVRRVPCPDCAARYAALTERPAKPRGPHAPAVFFAPCSVTPAVSQRYRVHVSGAPGSSARRWTLCKVTRRGILALTEYRRQLAAYSDCANRAHKLAERHARLARSVRETAASDAARHARNDAALTSVFGAPGTVTRVELAPDVIAALDATPEPSTALVCAHGCHPADCSHSDAEVTTAVEPENMPSRTDVLREHGEGAEPYSWAVVSGCGLPLLVNLTEAQALALESDTSYPPGGPTPGTCYAVPRGLAEHIGETWREMHEHATRELDAARVDMARHAVEDWRASTAEPSAELVRAAEDASSVVCVQCRAAVADSQSDTCSACKLVSAKVGPCRNSLATLDVSPACGLDGSDVDAELCRSCGTRSDWHDATDGACPDDDGPHPYSLAADRETETTERERIASHPVFAALSESARETIARSAPTASERIRAERRNMSDAHAEGLHAELPRDGCPECSGR